MISFTSGDEITWIREHRRRSGQSHFQWIPAVVENRTGKIKVNIRVKDPSGVVSRRCVLIKDIQHGQTRLIERETRGAR